MVDLNDDGVIKGVRRRVRRRTISLGGAMIKVGSHFHGPPGSSTARLLTTEHQG